MQTYDASRRSRLLNFRHADALSEMKMPTRYNNLCLLARYIHLWYRRHLHIYTYNATGVHNINAIRKSRRHLRSLRNIRAPINELTKTWIIRETEDPSEEISDKARTGDRRLVWDGLTH